MIENSMKVVDNSEDKQQSRNEDNVKENETGDKHAKVNSKPNNKEIKEVNAFEKQQKMEDLVDKQGKNETI